MNDQITISKTNFSSEFTWEQVINWILDTTMDSIEIADSPFEKLTEILNENGGQDEK